MSVLPDSVGHPPFCNLLPERFLNHTGFRSTLVKTLLTSKHQQHCTYESEPRVFAKLHMTEGGGGKLAVTGKSSGKGVRAPPPAGQQGYVPHAPEFWRIQLRFGWPFKLFR